MCVFTLCVSPSISLLDQPKGWGLPRFAMFYFSQSSVLHGDLAANYKEGTGRWGGNRVVVWYYDC